MNTGSLLTLPLENPVLIFAVILLTILIMPMVFIRLNIPGLIGLIISGIILGPNGIHLLSRDASIELFGTVGLLYIMFLAGLEIDMDEFKKNKHRGLVFGLITFSVPMLFGYIGAVSFLKMELLPAVLLASMFASHTLLAYPIASRLGIVKKESVTITVGGTIITDVLALLILAVIVRINQGEITALFWISLLLSIIVLSVFSFWALPRLTVWFFKNISGEGEQQFIFVLACVFFSAFIASTAGIEPIIGAFFAGLAINRYVPPSSALMNRINFVGNTIFIPFFLISVGMLVDLKVLFSGTQSLIVAATMTLIAITAKFIAAFITQKIFNYSSTERNIIFGLSNAQAAATLAAVIIAYRIGMFGNEILNGTIIMILVTCLLSSYVVEKQGRKLAINEEQENPEEMDLSERILIPISKPDTIPTLLDLAAMMKNPDSEEPLFALTVVSDEHRAAESIMNNYKKLDKAVNYASASENSLRIISRLDVNIASGILRGIKELVATDIILDWRGRFKSRHKILGNILDQLLNGSDKTFFVCKITSPLNIVNRIIVLLPPYAEYEKGFCRLAIKIKKLAKETGAKLVCFSNYKSLVALKSEFEKNKPFVETEYHEADKLAKLNWEKDGIKITDLFLFISARRNTISWHRSLDNFPRRFVRTYPDVNFIVLYPEQRLNKTEQYM